MKLKEVTYERLSNQRVGRYENERASCTVVINEGDSPEKALRLAQFYVDKHLGLLPTDEDVENALNLLAKAGINVVDITLEDE